MSAPKGISPGSILLAIVLRMEAWSLLLITAFMPTEPRDRYREERSCHLLDHLEDDRTSGRSSRKSAWDIFLRFVAGAPADFAACARLSHLLPDGSEGPGCGLAKRLVVSAGVSLVTAALCALAKRSGHGELVVFVFLAGMGSGTCVGLLAAGRSRVKIARAMALIILAVTARLAAVTGGLTAAAVAAFIAGLGIGSGLGFLTRFKVRTGDPREG
jgi:hypothetical protein